MASILFYFGVLRRFQHYIGHNTTGSWKGRGNQYIQFVRVLYCKLPTNGKQLPAFPLEAVTGTESRPQRWEARVLPLCHRGHCGWPVFHRLALTGTQLFSCLTSSKVVTQCVKNYILDLQCSVVFLSVIKSRNCF